MVNKKPLPTLQILMIFTLILITGCTAGSAHYTTDTPAGFWQGLWHGIISVITLIIHIFDNTIQVYEINNTGGWYDFGFLLGVICIWSGGSKVTYKSKKEKARDKEWEEIGNKVEKKVMHKLKEWADDVDESTENENWEEVSKKAEKKLKQKIREWAEKD